MDPATAIVAPTVGALLIIITLIGGEPPVSTHEHIPFATMDACEDARNELIGIYRVQTQQHEAFETAAGRSALFSRFFRCVEG